MAEPIRVGLVGATTDGTSWGARAHVPALKMLPDFQLKAICTAHEETARAAVEAYGAELAFHDYNVMFARPDIDVVSVAVRVPYHHEIAMAALKAGKNVYCEWPLGANVAEAEEMASQAQASGVKTMVGLQARSDPSINYLRDLIAGGEIGEVLSCHMTYINQGGAERPAARVWQTDRSKGANSFTIGGGHHLDALCFLLGEFEEVTGKLAPQIRQVKVTGTDQVVDVTSPDTVVVSGRLQSGALASIYIASVPTSVNAGWRLEVFGTQGTLTVSGAQANYSAEPLRLMVGKGREPLSELSVPEEYVMAPQGTPAGAPYNVAQAYTRFASAIRAGEAVDPDFELAARRHRLLAAIERASEEGVAVRL